MIVFSAENDDHGPVDDGLVVFGQAFVVADGASAAGDPGDGPLDDPAAGQHLEGVQVIRPFHDLKFQLRLELGLGPGHQLPGVAAVSSPWPKRGLICPMEG